MMDFANIDSERFCCIRHINPFHNLAMTINIYFTRLEIVKNTI